MILQVDNTAAIAFIEDSCERSNLKHIDVRQNWVRELRNRSVVVPTHVPSAANLADLFTKILDVQTFELLRNMMLVSLPENVAFPSTD